MFRNSGALDGPNGVSLLSVVFHSDDNQSNFESLAGVEPLPDSGTISADQAAAIVSIGLAVTPSTLLLMCVRLAKQQYPGML
jgi:hypothetical protein